MRILRWLMVRLAVVAILATASAARADDDDNKVPLDQVPKAVLDALKAKFPGARLKEAEKSVDKGKMVFELTFVHENRDYEAEFSTEGAILEVEKEIDIAELPADVVKGLKAKYPGATLKEAEEVKAGETLSYEVVIVTAGKKMLEVTLDKDGKVLGVEAVEDDDA